MSLRSTHHNNNYCILAVIDRVLVEVDEEDLDDEDLEGTTGHEWSESDYRWSPVAVALLHLSSAGSHYQKDVKYLTAPSKLRAQSESIF